MFDNSFLAKQHAEENEPNWDALDRDRWTRAPAGGEFNYYTERDQRDALDDKGPHGESFAAAARRFHVTFMIGNDQTKHASIDRIRAAGLSTGYRFRVTRCVGNGKRMRLTVRNVGVAPIYHDAYFAIGKTRSAQSLRGLRPGASLTVTIEAPSRPGKLAIASDRLVRGQRIEFEANLR